MTKQKTIQSLIADIDSLLAKLDSRFPWSKSNDLAHDRQVLERVRSYLLSMQQEEMAMTPTQQSAVRPIMQAVAQEMETIRQQVSAPLLSELSDLRQQRESLTQEIQQLELQKQQLLNTLTPMGRGQEQALPAFAQDLINQSTERLTQQLAQILLNLEAQLLNASSTSGSLGQQASAMMSPQERLQQLRQLQNESDRMLINIDANQRTLFEALNRDLQGYQQSLSQGIDKMHRLSNQGELLFTALVNRLAQLLGRETSTLVQSSLPWSEAAELSESIPSSTSSPPKPSSIFVGVDPVSQPEFNVTLSANASTPSPQLPVQLSSNIPDQQSTQELETENLAENSLDALIGWDMDTPIPVNSTLNYSEFPDLDFLLDIDSEQEPTTPSFLSVPIIQADATKPVQPDIAAQNEVENRHHEIDELYNTLFGTDFAQDTNIRASANTVEVTDANPSVASITTTDGQEDHSTDQAVGENVSVEVADYLFDGVIDPAEETSSPEPRVEGVNHDLLSWETLLFETPTTDAPIDSELVAAPETATHPHQEALSESQDVKTITALTDLLDEMGLSYSSPVTELPSMAATREEEWFLENPGETNSPVTSVDDYYIPASPDEDLLIREEFQQFSGQEIRLDQSTLDQLSEDLNSFEAVDHLNIVPQPSPSRDRIVPPPSFDLDSIQSLPMSEELLAEDWEEFALHDLSQEDVIFPDWLSPTPTDLDSRTPDPLVSDSEDTNPPQSPASEDVADDLSEESIDIGGEDVVKEYVLEDSVTLDQNSMSQPQETSLEDGVN
ncbi:hypothetical protein [Coleofasciculus sp.]|uniref:hypothetical protein n=1 Tax=Coleofasciculus sp. TaxID=3100458 RepID=UPI0039F9E1D1